FAGVHKLPVIFFCENNGYAISVPTSMQLACEKVSDRAIGYGMPGVTIDGNDPLAVFAAVKEAVRRAKRGEGPTLIEVITQRFTPHSSDDDDRLYRSESEIREIRKQDGIQFFADYLKQTGILTDELEQQ